MRILLAILLTLAALVAAAPSGSAVAICSTQADATDLVVGDDPIVRESCTTENIIAYDCDVTVGVDQGGSITRTLRCEPLIPCNPCCGYCPPPMESTAAAPAPCHTVGNPFLDAGFGVQCTAAATECHAVVATFGSVEDFLSPSVGCSTALWPPYDCVQDCDGPPTSSAAAPPCTVTSDASDLTITWAYTRVDCPVGPCTVGPELDVWGVRRVILECEPMIQCVTEPCPGSGGIKV